MTRPTMRTFVDAVVSHLAGTGFSIGDGAAPKSPSPATPYAVVYLIGALDRDGPVNDSEADEFTEIQVTSVGETRVQATGLADLVRSTLDSLTVAGRSVGQVRVLDGMIVERDDDVQPPLFYAIDTFSIWTTPG